MEDQNIGQKIYQLIEQLYPICRSITGDGVRQSLKILQQYIPVQIQEVPTGTAVFDWTVPKEWTIREAWIKAPDGRTIVDFKDHNLHVLNYSVPVHKKLPLNELQEHLFTLPDHPDWIPYRTSYYQENWGFCIPHRQYENLQEGVYEVYIDAGLETGSLTYGEYFIPGASDEIVLLSAHVCHPSLANDNLSGIGLLVYLAKLLHKQRNRYSYLFLFAPGTIGSITWLALNQERAFRIRHGLVATLLGDGGQFNYKKSRRATAEIDQVIAYVLQHSGHPFQIKDFVPYGYDERQFCSPGFNLAVGCLSRSTFGSFPEYHTSADNLEFVRPEFLKESFLVYRESIRLLEQNRCFNNLNPMCEPQLGKRGLYQAIGGQPNQKQLQMAMLWILNYSDGSHSLLDIAQKSNIPFNRFHEAALLLVDHNLISPVKKE